MTKLFVVLVALVTLSNVASAGYDCVTKRQRRHHVVRQWKQLFAMSQLQKRLSDQN